MLDLLRRVRYWLRQHLPWSPRVPVRTWAWSPPSQATPPEAFLHARQLQARHALSNGIWGTHAQGARESLYVLDVLDRHLSGVALPSGQNLDVGSKNGVYLPGLCAFRRGWDAVELDAHRRYLNLTTRRAHGEAVAARLDDCRYLAASVETLSGPYALITWFLPFVTQRPHVAWGLPRALFAPDRLLAHVSSLLAPGGVLFLVNQGPREATRQEQLLRAQGLSFAALGKIDSLLSPFQEPRFGFRVHRPP